MSLLLNIHRVSYIRQIELYTTEPLVPEPSPFMVKTGIGNLKWYNSPGINQIPSEFIQAVGDT
jgi:hypothetical protein